ncbi:hypothetical protein SHJG_0163 [Streptomyces hygroscopicus subsp. jinggangensis 5008]|nr:hypothetical protein SHJG_0163 [Streptomyces hygroscopicus subsp. jinggangensis 5008]
MARTAPDRLALITTALGGSSSADPEADAAQASSLLTHFVASAGLPTRLREVNIQRADLETIARLVQERYPAAVRQLDGTGRRLRALLESIW